MFQKRHRYQQTLTRSLQWSRMQPWPDLGLLWAHIAKVAAVLERDDVAAAAAETAAQIMQVTNGDCDVVHEMLRLRHDIGANMRIAPD